jgi:mediator of RNA polymerase II transcription subunit 14
MAPRIVWRFPVGYPSSAFVPEVKSHERIRRHALDFRLLSDQRVAIIDASHRLSGSGQLKTAQQTPQAPNRDLLLQPIPNLEAIVNDVIAHGGGRTEAHTVSLRLGIVCPTSSAGKVGRALHERILGSIRL